MRQYTDAGFSIHYIFSDQEFQPVIQNFKEAAPSIYHNLANSNKHFLKQNKTITLCKS